MTGKEPNYLKKKRCKNCGAIIKHEDTFCHKCLHEIEDKNRDLTQMDYKETA